MLWSCSVVGWVEAGSAKSSAEGVAVCLDAGCLLRCCLTSDTSICEGFWSLEGAEPILMTAGRLWRVLLKNLDVYGVWCCFCEDLWVYACTPQIPQLIYTSPVPFPRGQGPVNQSEASRARLAGALIAIYGMSISGFTMTWQWLFTPDQASVTISTPLSVYLGASYSLICLREKEVPRAHSHLFTRVKMWGYKLITE